MCREESAWEGMMLVAEMVSVGQISKESNKSYSCVCFATVH